MKTRSFAFVLAIVTTLATPPASALTVFDPSNYAQNVLQAVRALQQINNQIQSLQHEILMLQNMARNLERMDYSSIYAIQNALGSIIFLMNRAEGIAFEIGHTEREWARYYPQEYEAAVTGDRLLLDARQRWVYEMEGLRQTMLVQSQVVRNLEADNDELGRLIERSQAAIGNLQVSQAGNQLVALNIKQQIQLQELAAAQYRSEALERARVAMSQERARVQFEQFIGDGQGYSRAR